jgi:hypothetical protein
VRSASRRDATTFSTRPSSPTYNRPTMILTLILHFPRLHQLHHDGSLVVATEAYARRRRRGRAPTSTPPRAPPVRSSFTATSGSPSRRWPAARGAVALPLLSQMYVRAGDIPKLDADRRVPSRTKLGMAAEQLRWLVSQRGSRYMEVWAVVDGGYAKKPFLRPAAEPGVVVVGRLPCNAAPRDLPAGQPSSKRGPEPTYGKNKVVLKPRAGQLRGWEEVTCRWRPGGRRGEPSGWCWSRRRAKATTGGPTSAPGLPPRRRRSWNWRRIGRRSSRRSRT